jgi:predicted patatin/cPLA2 family phospholipase
MTFPSHIGLVLEGGGMRGVFTSGVIDYMIDHDLRFCYGVGVSAGACNGLSFMSRQRGRAKATNIDLLERYRYIGLKYIWKQHSILDAETIYDKIPNEVLPFDYDACFSNPMTFEMVTTDCVSGLPDYLTETSDKQRLLDIARASSSLPFVCPIVDVDGRPMLDGGIIDSIPVERAIATGHPRNIVVLTRQKGYRSTDRDLKTPRFIYREHPRLRLALSKRHEAYNRQLELVEQLERDGQVVVIRPKRPLEVGRLENDVKKLTRLYHEGYACARRVFSSLPEGYLPLA